MYLVVFITFLIISFLLLFSGYYDNNMILKVVAFFMLFVLGSVILISGVEIKIGETSNIIDCDLVLNNTYVSLDNYTNYNYMTICSDASYNTSKIIMEDTYETVTNKTHGFWLMIVAFFGWVSVYLQVKSSKSDED